MRRDVQERWVTALRSGNYGQVVGALHDLDDGGYCCLGVLCDLAVEDGAQMARTVTANGKQEYDGESEALPRPVMEWAGLDCASPSVQWVAETTEERDQFWQPGLDGQRDAEAGLADLNDTGWNFESIARLIEIGEVN